MGIQAVIPESGPQGTHPLGAPIVANHKNTSLHLIPTIGLVAAGA
jgi:hypothetical protein